MEGPYRNRTELEGDIAEKAEDYHVFLKALDLIHTRLLDSQSNSVSPLPLHKWGGAVGIRDLLEVVVNNMDRVKVDLEKMRESCPEMGRPKLRLVGSGDGKAN